MIIMKRKYLLVIGVIILLSGLIFIGYQIYEQRKEETRMAEEQREIEEAYRWIHYAIGRLVHSQDWDLLSPETLGEMSIYQPLESFDNITNDFGIFYRIYLVLRMYYHRGGVYLSYETVIDYFSEEFEPDGTLRLYNNGHHPEIEAFVVWMRKEPRIIRLGTGEVNNYFESLNDIYRAYVSAHRDEGFSRERFSELSPQMYDALARAEADPDYVLDLTSLQEQGY